MDILNIIAIIAVIALHCNGIVHIYSRDRSWATSLVVECVFYFAVPLFLMISGANLLSYRKKYDTKTFFKKRFCKVLIPFLFWTVFMCFWKSLIGEISFSNMTFKDIVNGFFANQYESTYYFLFIIIGIYLTLPLFSNLAEEKYRKSLWYIVNVYFIFNALIPNILKVFGINYNYDLGVNVPGYMIYIILGYLLSTQDVKKKHRVLIYIGAIVSIIYRYCMTYFLSNKMGAINKVTWGYTQFHVYILTVAVFLFIKNLKLDVIIKNDKIKSIIATISSCSFGIYLIHKIVMYYLCKYLMLNVYSWEYRTFGIVLMYLASLLIVWIMKKIPIVKKIVP